jgi:hypothetical protein
MRSSLIRLLRYRRSRSVWHGRDPTEPKSYQSYSRPATQRFAGRYHTAAVVAAFSETIAVLHDDFGEFDAATVYRS